MRLLLLEDDPLIGDGLEAGLAKFGFAVDWFHDGEAGQKALGTAAACLAPSIRLLRR